MRAATDEDVRQIRERLDADLAQLGPYVAPEERVRVRRTVAGAKVELEELRRLQAVRLRNIESELSRVTKPWLVAGPSVQQAMWAMLSRTGGRVWCNRLNAAGRELFGLRGGAMWAALRAMEKRKLVRIHMKAVETGGGSIRYEAPSWVEVLAWTGGDGVPPPVDRRFHGGDAPRPRPDARLRRPRPPKPMTGMPVAFIGGPNVGKFLSRTPLEPLVVYWRRAAV